MELRNYIDADFYEIMRLKNDIDLFGQTESEEEFCKSLSLPGSEPEQDIFVVLSNSVAIGFARVQRNRNIDVNRHTFNIILPQALQCDVELVNELLKLCECRIRDIALAYSEPLAIKSYCYEEEVDLVLALERNGYEMARYYARMDINDLVDLPDPSDINGITLRLFNRTKETSALREAWNLGFEGHYEHYPMSASDFENYLEGPRFQPENFYLAESCGRIVGICGCFVRPSPEADGLLWGVVSSVAVVSDFRGKGLGRALLRRGHLALRESGAERICLWVDYDNVSGAKELYYSEGYVDRYISKNFIKMPNTK